MPAVPLGFRFPVRDPLLRALLLAAWAVAGSSLLYWAVWSIPWSRKTFEVLALALALLGALLLIHDLFGRDAPASATSSDEPTFIGSAFLGLATGIALLALIHWRPNRHSLLANTGVSTAGLGISVLALTSLYKVAPGARKLVESRATRVGIATFVLVAAFLIQLRLALDTRL